MNNPLYDKATHRIGDEMMRKMKAMCQGRFGGDWSEVFARWDRQNDALPKLDKREV